MIVIGGQHCGVIMEEIQDLENNKDHIVGLVWDSLLDSDMNVRYWNYVCRRYYFEDRLSKILLAITSSTTVASWTLWSHVEIVWKILSGISAIVAISLPILNLQKLIQSASELRVKWSQLLVEYENLWTDILHGKKVLDEIVKEFKHIKQNEPTGAIPPGLPSNKKKLIERCQDEVMASRGME